MLKHWTTFIFAASQLAASQKFTGITVDTYESTNQPGYAIDGNISTFWHSEYTPVLTPLPHQAVLDLGSATTINGFTYLPRQDGLLNGNIGTYGLEVSKDKEIWTVVSNATWLDDQSPKVVGFPTTSIRYLRLTAYTEAGNRGPWCVVFDPFLLSHKFIAFRQLMSSIPENQFQGTQNYRV
jgi:galactose oxidase